VIGILSSDAVARELAPGPAPVEPVEAGAGPGTGS
jgi:hypothetical protein